MRKAVRHWYWGVPALLVIAAGWYTAYPASHPPWADRDTWAVYQQVGIGMSGDEFNVVADSRPRLAWAGHEALQSVVGDDATTGQDERVLLLIGGSDGDEVGVLFDHDGRVQQKWATVEGHKFSDPPYASAWRERLRTLLGW